MGAYLAKTFRRNANGTKLIYYVLRENYWDRKQRRQRQRYLGYIGAKPVISEAKARKIAKKIGCTLDDLRAVRGLKIVKDGSRGGGKSS